MNDDVNQALESAGRDVRAMVTGSIDVEADLSATLQRSPQSIDESPESARSRVGFIVVGVAAAMVLLLVGVLAVVSGGSADDVPTGTIEAPPDRTITPATIEGSMPTTEQASEISAPPRSVERSTPTTEQASEISAPQRSAPLSGPLLVSLPPQPVVVPVSYLDPPELYEPEPFVSIQMSATTDEYGGFAVGDGIVVITERGPVVTVVDVNTGSATSQALAVEISSPVLGPGNVLYGLSIVEPTDSRQQMPETALVAQSLDTDPSTILASVSVGWVSYMEIPVGTFVAGPDGIYDVERARGKVMDFVGTIDTTTSAAVIALENAPEPTVRTIDGAAEWAIPVEADPNAGNLYAGPTPPAPGPNGTTRVARHIGPRLETEPVDFGTPTKQVIADLAPGAGRWWSLPDDWRAVASSSYGTLLVRGSGGNLDLAWFQPDPPPPLPFWPTTVLASDGNNIMELARDDTGTRTQRWPGDRVGWANGCTPDEVDALFAEVPEGSVLEQLACDRTTPTIAEADFSIEGVRSTISLIDDPASGWTTEFDDIVSTRFANLATTPIVSTAGVPAGDTLPIGTPLGDRPAPDAPALYEIVATATTPAEFGNEITRLLQEAAPNFDATSTIHELPTGALVVVTQQAAGGTETIHYYWLSDQGTSLTLDRAVQTTLCTSTINGAACD